MSFNPTPISAPLKATHGLLDYAAANLLAAFKGCLLTPIPSDTDPDHIPVPFLTETSKPEFNAKLTTQSVAVSLGPRSSGLIGIKVAGIAGLSEFLARNVSCEETLITDHDGGAIIWLHATTAHRAPLDLPNLQLRMTGNLLVFDRQALRCRDEFLNINEIKAADLLSLDWGPDPDGRVAAWLATLSHGDFVRRPQRGRIHPRRDPWRDYLLRRLKPTTAFDRATGGFWRRLNGEVWQPLNEQQLIGEIRQQVVSAPVPGAQAHSWCNDEWLAGMLRYLRRALVGEVPFAVNHLRAFARGALVLSPGRDVTVRELYAAFSRFCRERQFPLMSPAAFQKQIPKVLNEPPWGRAKSKSVQRASRSQNGFRGLVLRLAV